MSLIDVNDRIVFIKIRHREIKMRMSIIMINILFVLFLLDIISLNFTLVNKGVFSSSSKLYLFLFFVFYFYQ